MPFQLLQEVRQLDLNLDVISYNASVTLSQRGAASGWDLSMPPPEQTSDGGEDGRCSSSEAKWPPRDVGKKGFPKGSEGLPKSRS